MLAHPPGDAQPHLPVPRRLTAATKRDLDHFATVFEAKLDAGLAGVRTEAHREIGSPHQAIGGQTRSLFLGLVGLQLSGAGLAVVLRRVL